MEDFLGAKFYCRHCNNTALRYTTAAIVTTLHLDRRTEVVPAGCDPERQFGGPYRITESQQCLPDGSRTMTRQSRSTVVRSVTSSSHAFITPSQTHRHTQQQRHENTEASTHRDMWHWPLTFWPQNGSTRCIATTPEKDQVTAIGNMHKRLVKTAHVVAKISPWPDKHTHTNILTTILCNCSHKQSNVARKEH